MPIDFINKLKELDVLRKTVIIQWNACKKIFFADFEEINRKNAYPCNAKEHYQSFIRKKKQNQ